MSVQVRDGLAYSLFEPVEQCWVCGDRRLVRYHQGRLDFHVYATQDPGLDAYTGQRVRLVECRTCGFGQPEELPTLPGFFDRMYDQRWDERWVEHEFAARYKDFIFRGILRQLRQRVASGRRRLLDVGAHAGRFMFLAQQRGWDVEGIELNARTAACAASRTGAPVHRVNATTLAVSGRRYDAVTLTDVLEHIPNPLPLLQSLAQILEPGGCLAVKVPCGPSQRFKEQVLTAFVPGRSVSLADNLVHVNHFSARSLRHVLARAGFRRIDIRSGAPELLPLEAARPLRVVSNVGRLAVYLVASLPGAVRTPLALHLQAYASK
jgi:SAM-dependent methyltransferase